MKELYQIAVEYVMDFYGLSYEDATELYKDEIEAAVRLFQKGILTLEGNDL